MAPRLSLDVLQLQRSFLHLIFALAFHIALSPPKASRTETYRYTRKNLFESISGIATRLTVICVWLASLAPALLLTADGLGWKAGKEAAPSLCYSQDLPSSIARLAEFDPAFNVGFILVVASCVLRVLCYRALGRNFTFEVVIRENHSLITHGPYAYVRHPSYTALFAAGLGTLMCLGLPGSWIWECKVVETWGCGIVVLWLAWFAFANVGIWKRANAEDIALQRTFGEKWASYASAVPWKFIPGAV